MQLVTKQQLTPPMIGHGAFRRQGRAADTFKRYMPTSRYRADPPGPKGLLAFFSVRPVVKSSVKDPYLRVIESPEFPHL